MDVSPPPSLKHSKQKRGNNEQNIHLPLLECGAGVCRIGIHHKASATILSPRSPWEKAKFLLSFRIPAKSIKFSQLAFRPVATRIDWFPVPLLRGAAHCLQIALRRNGRVIFLDHGENGSGLSISISCREHEGKSYS